MPNPSAKHDPEGMGGIVNIVLQENLDLGLSGSLSANTSTRHRHSFWGRLNYQKGRFTVFTGVGLGTYQDAGTSYDLRQNLVTSPVTLIEQDAVTDSRSLNLNGDWTAELKVGQRGTLWSNAWLYGGGWENRGLTEYGIMTDARSLLDRYDRSTDSESKSANYNIGVGFKQIFQPQKEELTVDGRVSSGQSDNDTRLRRLFQMLEGQPVQLPLELTLNEIESGNADLWLQADYFRPFAGGRIDIGYRSYRRSQDNDNQLRVFESLEAPVPSEETRAGYDYDEVFHSLYSTLGRTWGRFGAQLGLRAELSRSRFESLVTDASFERDYNTLFPSVNVSWTLRPGRTARLLYSKRISRPNPYYLDPFVPATDPLNRSYGNPVLRPSYTQSVTFDFSWTGSKGTLRVAPYYRRSTDVWERIRTVDTLRVASTRWENAATATAYGSSFTISLPPTRRVSGSTSFSVYHDVRDGTNISSAYRRSAVMWSMGGNVGVKITPRLTAQTYANYFPTQSILQGRASGYTYTSVAVRQQLWGTRGSLSLSINDPFDLYRFNSSTRDATHIQNSRSSYRSRVATVGFTWNFGRPPQQMSRRSGGEEVGETIRVR